MIRPSISFKLPFEFDGEKLAADLAVAEQYEFSAHPLRYHDGSWQVINLIYAGGDTVYRHEGDFGFGDQPPEPTSVLKECAYFNEVLHAIPGTMKMARLSSLPAGGRILRHYDPIESVDFDNIRLHIPVRTDAKVAFYLGYRREVWRVGEAWYGDFTFPHSIYNRSNLDRVHIIVDLVPDDACRSWFPPGYLDEDARAKRQVHRQRMKDWSWYHTRLENLFGRGPAQASA